MSNDKKILTTLTLKSPEENTFKKTILKAFDLTDEQLTDWAETKNDWAAQAQEHLEELEQAKSEGVCVYCGDETDNGDCNRYKCWVY